MFRINDGDVLTVGFYWQGLDQIGICRRTMVWNSDVGGGAFTTTTKLFVALDASGLSGFLKAIVSSNAVFLGWSAVHLPNPDKLATEYSTLGTGAGTSGDDMLPRQSAGLIKFTSPIAGKHGQGHMYIPFPALVDCEGPGEPKDSYVTRLNDIGGVLSADLNLADTTGGDGNLRSCLRPITGTVGEPAQIDGFVSYKAFATQKRRGSFGKLNRSPFV